MVCIVARLARRRFQRAPQASPAYLRIISYGSQLSFLVQKENKKRGKITENATMGLSAILYDTL